jgi:hypothetical protein
MNSHLKDSIGKKVIVDFRGLEVVAKLISLPETFKGRDALVQFPTEKRTRRFWASKITPIK